VSIWSIMVFLLCFAAGMSLIDTTDGVLMLASITGVREADAPSYTTPHHHLGFGVVPS